MRGLHIMEKILVLMCVEDEIHGQDNVVVDTMLEEYEDGYFRE